MLKRVRKQLKNEKGLTLVELLAVIVILGIVAAIAVPAIGNIIENSRDGAKLGAAANILAGAKIAATDGACDDIGGNITCDQDDLEGYVENVKGPDNEDALYSAERTGNVWTVTYNGLTDFNSKKYSGAPTGSISEPDLNQLLDGNNEDND